MNQQMDHDMIQVGPWPEPVQEQEIQRLNRLERRFVLHELERQSPLLFEHLTDPRGHWSRDTVRALAEASPDMFRSIIAQLSPEVHDAIR